MPAFDIADRFVSKIDFGADCWVWTAATDDLGYGKYRDGGRAGRTVFAHRHAYEKAVGPVPDGLVLDHLCRVPGCVNPDHLEPVTQAENLRRGVIYPNSMKARAARMHCKRGHEWTADTIIWSANGRARSCRLCKSIRERERKAERARV